MHLINYASVGPLSLPTNALCANVYATLPFLGDTDISSIINQAEKLETFRCMHLTSDIGSLLENIGYDKRTAHKLLPLFRSIYPMNGVEPAVEYDSALGEVLTELRSRERAFQVISRNLHHTSDIIMREVAFPLSRKLRKKAERQARTLLEHRNPFKIDYLEATQPSLSYGWLEEQLIVLREQFQTSINWFDRQFSLLPGVSGESHSASSVDCRDDFLTDDCFTDVSLEKIEQTKKTVEQDMTLITGKNCLRVLAYDGMGGEDFINYLFSKKCTRGQHGVQCDTSPCDVAQSKPTLRIFPLHQTLGFAAESVIVDFPGFLWEEKLSPQQLVQTMMSAKAIVDSEVHARSVVDIIMIDYETLLANRGTLKTFVEALKLHEPAFNKLLVITNVSPASADIPDTRNPQPTKEDIIQFLSDNENNIHRDLANHLILFDASDRDLRQNTLRQTGGRTERAQLVQTIENMQKRAVNQKEPNPYSMESFMTPSLKRGLETIAERLRSELTDEQQHGSSKTFERIEALMHINFAPVKERIDSAIDENLSWDSLKEASKTRFKAMLQSGVGTSFFEHLHTHVLRLQNLPWTRGRFDLSELSQIYTRAILDADKINVTLSEGPALEEFEKQFPAVIPEVMHAISKRLAQIKEAINESLKICSGLTDHESEKWKTTTKILKRTIDDSVFSEIDKLATRSSTVQKKKLEERKTLIDNGLRSIRNSFLELATVGTFVALIYYSCLAGRSRGAYRDRANSLYGYLGGMEVVEFKEDDRVLTSGLENYNVWKRVQGRTLGLIGQVNLNAAGNILKIAEHQYTLLTEIPIRERLMEMERHFDDKINAVRMGYSAVVCSNLFLAFTSLSITMQLALAAGTVFGGLSLDQVTITYMKTLGVERTMTFFYANEFDFQACQTALAKTPI